MLYSKGHPGSRTDLEESLNSGGSDQRDKNGDFIANFKELSQRLKRGEGKMTRILFMGFALAFYGSNAFACIGGVETTITSYESTPDGYNLLLSHGKNSFVVRGSDGAFIMLNNIFGGKSEDYNRGAKKDGFMHGWSEETCKPGKARESTIILNGPEAALFSESVGKIKKVLTAEANKSDSKLLTASAKQLGDIVDRPIEQAKSGAISFPLSEWCKLGQWQGKLLKIDEEQVYAFEYVPVKQGENWKDVGSDPKVRGYLVPDRSGVDSGSSPEMKAFEDDYEAIAEKMASPPDQVRTRGSCNASFGKFAVIQIPRGEPAESSARPARNAESAK